MLDKLSQGYGNEQICFFTSDTVMSAVQRIGLSKSKGPDGLTAEHFRFAPPTVWGMLANLFNSCLAHSFLPKHLLDVNIMPILKKKGLDCKKSQDYRPIALATAASKIFEHALYEKIASNLTTGKWQFGYKAGHGTELAVLALKSVVGIYKKKGTPVIATFMDASKAFDSVLHSKLCLKLLDRKVPVEIVRIIYQRCKTQNFKILWDGVLSRPFCTQKAVRQGGVLSPYFNECLFTWMVWEHFCIIQELVVKLGRIFTTTIGTQMI